MELRLRTGNSDIAFFQNSFPSDSASPTLTSHIVQKVEVWFEKNCHSICPFEQIGSDLLIHNSPHTSNSQNFRKDNLRVIIWIQPYHLFACPKYGSWRRRKNICVLKYQICESWKCRFFFGEAGPWCMRAICPASEFEMQRMQKCPLHSTFYKELKCIFVHLYYKVYIFYNLQFCHIREGSTQKRRTNVVFYQLWTNK